MRYCTLRQTRIDVALLWIRPCSDWNELLALLLPCPAGPGTEGPLWVPHRPDRYLIATPRSRSSFLRSSHRFKLEIVSVRT